MLLTFLQGARCTIDPQLTNLSAALDQLYQLAYLADTEGRDALLIFVDDAYGVWQRTVHGTVVTAVRHGWSRSYTFLQTSASHIPVLHAHHARLEFQCLYITYAKKKQMVTGFPAV